MASKVEDRDKMLRFLFPRLEASDQALVQRFLEEVRKSALRCIKGKSQLT